MNKTFISLCKFIVAVCPALVAYNNLQAHSTHPYTAARSIMIAANGSVKLINNGTSAPDAVAQFSTATSEDSSIDKNPQSDANLAAGNAVPSNKGRVDISWITRNDSTSDRFEIERSFDAQNFQMVGMIFTSDDRTLSANGYSFRDQSALLSQHPAAYYRVKQVAANGNMIYSAVKSVSLKPVTLSNHSTGALQPADPASWKANNSTNNQPVITGLTANGHKAI